MASSSITRTTPRSYMDPILIKVLRFCMIHETRNKNVLSNIH